MDKNSPKILGVRRFLSLVLSNRKVLANIMLKVWRHFYGISIFCPSPVIPFPIWITIEDLTPNLPFNVDRILVCQNCLSSVWTTNHSKFAMWRNRSRSYILKRIYFRSKKYSILAQVLILFVQKHNNIHVGPKFS